MPEPIILPHAVSGPAGAPTLVFLHGWPESGAMWDDAVGRLRGKYRCVTMTMPHYGGRAEARERGYSRLGYRFDDVADMIAATVRATCRDKAVLVAFDMGSLWGQALLERHADLISKVVLVDVGVLATGRSTLQDIRDLVKLGRLYQYFQIIAFFLGLIPYLWIVIDRLLIAVLKRTQAEAKSDFKTVSSDIGYAYFHRHLQIVLEFLRIRKPLLTKPIENFPAQPTLFLYGTNKSINFYSDKWFSAIKNRKDGSETFSFPAMHWLMFTHPTEFAEKIDNWLQSTGDASDK